MKPSFPLVCKRQTEHRYKNTTSANLFNLSLLIHPLILLCWAEEFRWQLNLNLWCIFLIPMMAAKHGRRRSYSRREQCIFTLCFCRSLAASRHGPWPLARLCFPFGCSLWWKRKPIKPPLEDLDWALCLESPATKGQGIICKKRKLQIWKLYKMVFHVFLL